MHMNIHKDGRHTFYESGLPLQALGEWRLSDWSPVCLQPSTLLQPLLILGKIISGVAGCLHKKNYGDRGGTPLSSLARAGRLRKGVHFMSSSSSAHRLIQVVLAKIQWPQRLSFQGLDRAVGTKRKTVLLWCTYKWVLTNHFLPPILQPIWGWLCLILVMCVCVAKKKCTFETARLSCLIAG